MKKEITLEEKGDELVVYADGQPVMSFDRKMPDSVTRGIAWALTEFGGYINNDEERNKEGESRKRTNNIIHLKKN